MVQIRKQVHVTGVTQVVNKSYLFITQQANTFILKKLKNEKELKASMISFYMLYPDSMF